MKASAHIQSDEQDHPVELLVNRCRNGEESAFSELVDVYADRCYGYFYRLTGNETESHDLLSDLFIKLYQKIDSFKGGSFDKWLFTIASNLFHDYLRYQYRRKKLLDGKIQELMAKPRISRHEEQMLDNVQLLLEKLDNETRELIMLRYYSRMSFKELSRIRKEPLGTTLSKVHRGLQKLRDLYNDTGDELL